MVGFMADFEADLATPHGVAKAMSGLMMPTAIVGTASVTSTGNQTVPPGAKFCIAYATGGGGGGGYYNGGLGYMGGAAGVGIGLFAVNPGDAIACVVGAGGAGGTTGGSDGTGPRAPDGGASIVTYNKLIQAQGAGGYGGQYGNYGNGSVFGTDPLGSRGGTNNLGNLGAFPGQGLVTTSANRGPLIVNPYPYAAIVCGQGWSAPGIAPGGPGSPGYYSSSTSGAGFAGAITLVYYSG